MKKYFSLLVFIVFFALFGTSCSKPKDITKPDLSVDIPVENKIYSGDIVFRGTSADNELNGVFLQLDSFKIVKTIGSTNWIFFPTDL